VNEGLHGVTADSIRVTSNNAASIDAVAGAAALSASLAGGGSAISVAIGLSVALNEVGSDALAVVDSAHAMAQDGDVSIDARASGVPVAPQLAWSDMLAAGLKASVLDALAKPPESIALSSNDDRTWDFTDADGVVELVSGMKVLRSDGEIYEYDGDRAEIDLGAQDYSSSDWEQLDRPEVELKPGFLVRVDAAHTAGGLAGRVYEYVGPDDYHEKNQVALSTFDYSDTSLWQLAPEFADPADYDLLKQVLIDAGVNLANEDVIRPTATYSSLHDGFWDYTSDDGERKVTRGDIVADTADDKLYRYVGEDDETLDLKRTDFSDASRWSEIVYRADHVLPDPFVDLTADDLVVAAPGGSPNIFAWAGDDTRINLADADYGDEGSWSAITWHDGRFEQDLSLATNDVVLMGDGSGTFEAYEYLGADDDIIWASVDFDDADLWLARTVMLHRNDPEIEIKKGDVVQVTLDGATQMLRYTGDDTALSLPSVDYGDGFVE